jgi:hypothetical protein
MSESTLRDRLSWVSLIRYRTLPQIEPETLNPKGWELGWGWGEGGVYIERVGCRYR